MAYLLLLLSAIVILLIYMRFEAGFAEIKRVYFTNSKSFVKILQLSDIHLKYLRVPEKKIRLVVESEKPDIVIITGDYIDNIHQIGDFLKFLDTIRLTGNTYLCLGNHDYKAFSGNMRGLDGFVCDIEGKGIQVLQNRVVCYQQNKKKYNIIGIMDKSTGIRDIGRILDQCAPDAFANIAFSHNPDIILQIPEGKIDYLFCGHYHGGQIKMPFNLEYKMLRRDILCKIGIRKGLHTVNGIRLYINRGLGCVCFPLRFLSRPEITIFYLP